LDPNGQTFSVVQIDPSTGALTTLVTLPAPTFGGSAGSIAFDGEGKYYGALPSSDTFSSPSILRIEDVASGAVQSTALTAENLTELGYDSSLGRVIAASIQSSAVNEVDGVNIVTIDPSTGAVATKASFPSLKHVFMTARATDSTTHRYFFIGGEGPWEGGSAWMTGNDLLTIDVSTGDVLAKPSISWTHALFSLQFVPG